MYVLMLMSDKYIGVKNFILYERYIVLYCKKKNTLLCIEVPIFFHSIKPENDIWITLNFYLSSENIFFIFLLFEFSFFQNISLFILLSSPFSKEIKKRVSDNNNRNKIIQNRHDFPFFKFLRLLILYIGYLKWYLAWQFALLAPKEEGKKINNKAHSKKTH